MVTRSLLHSFMVSVKYLNKKNGKLVYEDKAFATGGGRVIGYFPYIGNVLYFMGIKY